MEDDPPDSSYLTCCKSFWNILLLSWGIVELIIHPETACKTTNEFRYIIAVEISVICINLIFVIWDGYRLRLSWIIREKLKYVMTPLRMLQIIASYYCLISIVMNTFDNNEFQCHYYYDLMAYIVIIMLISIFVVISTISVTLMMIFCCPVILWDFIKEFINKCKLSESSATQKWKVFQMVIGADHIIDSTCVICIEEYKDNDNIRQLPCQHVFHQKCIDSWFLKRQTCPICRQKGTDVVPF